MRWTSAKYHDLFDRKQNIEFFTEMAKDAGRVLDVGAGTGRLSIAMALAGAQVTSVEQDANFRALMKRNIEEQPKEVRTRIDIIKGDILNFSTARRFPMIILSGVLESFFKRAQRFDVLKRFHELLNSGGRLVFDLLSINIGEFSIKEVDRIEDNGTEYIRKMACTIDKILNVAKIRYVYETYVSGNYYDQVDETIEIAMVQPREISEGLMEAGFRDFNFYGGYDRRPYDLYARTLVVEAWKK